MVANIMSLSGIVGIVSGGASGLGAATVYTMIRHGARVVVADLPHQKETFLKNDLDKAQSVFCAVDVTSEQDVAAALDLAQQEFGEPINAAINCAGFALAQKTLRKDKTSGNLVPHSLPDFSSSLQVNCVGSFNMARLAAQQMANRSPDKDGLRGCIINTASIAAFDGQIGQVAYAASKGAIVGMTLPMARDLAPLGIRVMTIAPGLFHTPLLDGLPEAVQQELGNTVPCPNRLGRPEEFGKLVASILTNSMLNGEVIRLDGALRMPPK